MSLTQFIRFTSDASRSLFITASVPPPLFFHLRRHVTCIYPSPSHLSSLSLTIQGAIEKVLRLLQSLSQIIAASALANINVKLWWELRRNFALGRRYLRFFRFLDCFAKAFEALRGLDGDGAGAGVKEVLIVGKWTFMGVYLGLESVTILDAMRIWNTPWASTCLLEGNKFWFYSLVCEIIWSGMVLFEREREVVVRGEKGKSKSKIENRSIKEEMARKKKRAGIRRRMMVDAFDLFIPGDVTGWIPSSLLVVGWAGAISTLLSMMDIWDKMST